ncbi:MAG: hypothetical protein J6P97_05120 [Bacteroidales bacterium]|nr:hypothetical protein [Bacteroidales bacterium]
MIKLAVNNKKYSLSGNQNKASWSSSNRNISVSDDYEKRRKEIDAKNKELEKIKQQNQAAQRQASGLVKNISSNSNRGYVPSQSVTNAQNKKTQAENAVSNYGDFTYKNQDALQAAMDAITNREAFSYDLNADALYQQYKDNYMAQGKQAMTDAMGQAAALTGGYGSSYASSVGNQAYQGYLQKLNDVVPELYGLALDTYQIEGQRLKDNYGVLSTDRDTEYGMYVDKYNRLAGDRDYYSNDYYNVYNQDYGQYRDNVADEQWNKEFDEGVRQYNEGMAYQRERDNVADSQWQKEFDEDTRRYNQNYNYQVGRDKVADSQWERQFTYGQERDKVADEQWNKTYNEGIRQYELDRAYQKDRDAVADSQWQQQFTYGQSRDKVADDQWERQFAYGQERDKVADSQWERQFAKSSSGGSGGSRSSGDYQGAGDDGHVANSTQVSKFKNGVVSEKNFMASAQPITRGNRGNTGNGGFKYNGTTYRDYNDYIYKELERSYNYGLIDEGTLSYLLDEYNF